jgi:hypothetical protein
MAAFKRRQIGPIAELFQALHQSVDGALRPEAIEIVRVWLLWNDGSGAGV